MRFISPSHQHQVWEGMTILPETSVVFVREVITFGYMAGPRGVRMGAEVHGNPSVSRRAQKAGAARRVFLPSHSTLLSSTAALVHSKGILYFLALLISLCTLAFSSAQAQETAPGNSEGAVILTIPDSLPTDIRPYLKPVVTPAGAAAITLQRGKDRITISLPKAKKGTQRLWYGLLMRVRPSSPQNVSLWPLRIGISTAGKKPLRQQSRLERLAIGNAAESEHSSEASWGLTLSPGLNGLVLASPRPLRGPVLMDQTLRARQRREDLSVAGGMLFGMSLLIGLASLFLALLRRMPSLVAQLPLHLGGLLFVLINGGMMARLFPAADTTALLSRMELLAEGLIIFGTIGWCSLACARTSSSKSKNAARLSSLAGGIVAVLLLAALFLPEHLTFLFRATFAGGVALCLGMAISSLRHPARGSAALARAIPPFLLTIWTMAAAYALLSPFTSSANVYRLSLLDPAILDTLLSGGLVLVQLSAAMAGLQMALSPSAQLRRFLDESMRKALALHAAELAVWELDLLDSTLHIDPRLEKNLDMEPGSFAGNAWDAFVTRIHPDDAPAFHAAMQAVGRGERRRLAITLRLQKRDDDWCWFSLKGEAICDDPERAGPTRILGALHDITAFRQSEERLLSDAVRDRVTGLANRALFLDRLQRALTRTNLSSGPGKKSTPREAPLSLLVVDIDRFRSINDAWGHEVGDALLMIMAERIRDMLEPADTLGRVAGDQFAILLDMEACRRDPTAFAHRLHTRLRTPYEVEDRDISLTTSIGVVALFAGEVTRAEDALKRAEIALLAARTRGRGGVALFERRMLGERMAAVQLEHDLRRAVERGQIDVAYQPIVRLEDEELAGFEALVRWHHPALGTLTAERFVPLAEELGLIADITQVVLEKAVRNLGVWQRALRPSQQMFVSVNISSMQLMNTDLVREVAELIDREGIAPETLILELTESLVLDNPQLGRKVLKRLARLDIGLACDDFGTGYSSMTILRDMPFSIVKLDRSLLAEGDDPLRSAIILRSTVDMAHALDMSVIVEGVESAEHMMLVHELGCDMAQGWHVGRPISAQKVTEILMGIALQTENGQKGSLFSRFLDALAKRQGSERKSPDDPASETERSTLEQNDAKTGRTKEAH